MRLPTAFCSLGVALSALACAPAARADGVRALRYDTRIDVAVTSMGGVWWLSSELLKADLVPEKCRWCYRAADGTDRLNPFDAGIRRAVLWKNPRAAGIASNVLGFFVLPGSMMGLTAIASADDDATRGFPVDALLITEATVIAADVNQLAKFAFARERPFVHYLPRAPDAVRALTDSPSDDNLSFFSGHTTLAFAIGTSAPMIATLRGYRLAPVLWASGLTMATAVGYLRIAADKHYFSDVIVGALVGSVIGIGVPLLFHAPIASSSSRTAIPPSASGQALSPPPIRTAFSMNGAF